MKDNVIKVLKVEPKKEPETMEECVELFDKYISEGDKDKARKCLKRTTEIGKEILGKCRKENERIMKKIRDFCRGLH